MEAYIEKWGNFDDGVADYDPDDPNTPQNSNNMEVPVLDRSYQPERDGQKKKSPQDKNEQKKDEKVEDEEINEEQKSSSDDDDIQITEDEEEQDPTKNTRTSGSFINEIRKNEKREKKK